MTAMSETMRAAAPGLLPEEQDRPEGQVVTFYSYKGGTGRTMALANTAWILAANGFRVLVVDWDLEAPGLDRFFHPFLDRERFDHRTGVIDMIVEYVDRVERAKRNHWTEKQIAAIIPAYAAVGRHTLDLTWSRFPSGGCLSYLSPGQMDPHYSDALNSLNWNDFYAHQYGGEFLQAMRADMVAHYDYVLIDSRTGLSDTSGICTVDMPDTLVVCFTLSDQSINGASDVAGNIRRDRPSHLRPIRILPVPMRIDEGELEKVQAGRDLARVRFAGMPDGLKGVALTEYWGAVQFPYRPFYAYEEILSVFGDQPGDPGSLLASCERLAKVITDGAVTGLPPMDETLRLQYRDRYARRRSSPVDLHLAHVPEDRTWAHWIAEVLESAGYQLTVTEIGHGWQPDQAMLERLDAATQVITVYSRAFQRSAKAQEFWDRATTRDVVGGRGRPLAVRVGNVQLDVTRDRRDKVVDLALPDSRTAIHALLRAVDPERSTALAETVHPASRFPGSQPLIWQVPPRNLTFTGRAEELEGLRERLRRGNGAVLLPAPQALQGTGGVGKTQLAKEFAHRYRADYDLVWWVNADQPDLVPVELAKLARQLDGIRSDGEPLGGLGTGAVPTAAAAVEALRLGRPSPHWLLVFDNAGEPSDVQEYIPDGPGHVIITSRNSTWQGYAERVDVNVFTREESVEHLRSRVPALTAEEADRVAELVGDLPLAVELSAAWLTDAGTVHDYVPLLEEQLARVLAVGTPTDYPHNVAATWNISIETLRSQSPAAARVLELCAFLGPEPISMSLLNNRELLRELADLAPGGMDRSSFGTVFREMGKYSLARIDNADGSIQLHRLVQAVIRDGLDEEQQRRNRERVHRLLTEERARIGGEIEDDERGAELERLWPHLMPSQSHRSLDEEMRELMIDWVRYLWWRGEFGAARSVAEDLERHWRQQLGEEDWLILRLRFELGNVLRSEGRYEDSLKLDQETMERQTRLRGPDNVHTLTTTGSVAADLRALGRYDEALELDRQTYALMTQRLGPDHVRTMRMANNLAVDQRLMGNFEEAQELDRQTAVRRLRVLGPTDRETLMSQAMQARDLRDVGQLREAATRLQGIHAQLEATLGEDHMNTLRVARSLAVSLRLVGNWTRALEINQETYRRCRERYGAGHDETWLCALNLAADLWTLGHYDEAMRHAEGVHAEFLERLGAEHPNTLGCADNLAVYLPGNGTDPERLEHGLRLSRLTAEAMEQRLGPDHPFTLCSLSNLANVLGQLGRHRESEEAGRTAWRRIRARYGESHLDGLVCAANLAVTLEQQGKIAEAERLRAEALPGLLRLLGSEHPEYLFARRGERVSRILELQPW
jgi:tetratricopeptide (TPR) repeat protein